MFKRFVALSRDTADRNRTHTHKTIQLGIPGIPVLYHFFVFNFRSGYAMVPVRPFNVRYFLLDGHRENLVPRRHSFIVYDAFAHYGCS